jgi:hypothetical protein
MLFREIIAAYSANNMKYIKNSARKMQSTERGEIKEVNSAKWNVLYSTQNLPSTQNCMITLYCCICNKIRQEIWPNSSKLVVASGTVVGASIAPQDGRFGLRLKVDHLEIFKRHIPSVHIQ